MIVEFNLANILWVVFGLLSGIWALIKIIAVQFKRQVAVDLQQHFTLQEVASKAAYTQINLRLDTLDTAAKADTGQWQRVERELLALKADLPVHYVRRDDYIRGQSVIEAKLDGLGVKLENVQLRARQTN